MADIWNTEPPRWLQADAKGIDTQKSGELFAGLIGGGYNALTNSNNVVGQDDKGKDIHSSFMQTLGQGIMAAQDPFYMAKAEAFRDEASLRHQQTQDVLKSKSEIAQYKQKWQTEGKGNLSWMKDNPLVSDNPATMKWMDDTDTKISKSGAVEQVKKADATLDDALGKIIGDTSISGTLRGQAMDVLRTQDPVKKQTMSDELFKQIPAIPKAESPVGKLQADRAAALARGDTEAVKQFDAAIIEATTNKGRSIYMGMGDDGKPVFELTEGGATSRFGGATVGMATKAQERLVQYKNAVQSIDQINITPNMVGVKGTVGEWAIDRGLAQITGLSKGERVNGRTAMKLLKEGMMREVSDTQRYSVKDREEIEEIFPSTGFFESADRANKALQTIRQVFANRARNYANSIGKPLPVWTMTPQELKTEFPTKEDVVKAVKDSKISRDDAVDVLTKGEY
jgi:hypothetical protein